AVVCESRGGRPRRGPNRPEPAFCPTPHLTVNSPSPPGAPPIARLYAEAWTDIAALPAGPAGPAGPRAPVSPFGPCGPVPPCLADAVPSHAARNCAGVLPPNLTAFDAVPAVTAWRASGTIPAATAPPDSATNSAIDASTKAATLILDFIRGHPPLGKWEPSHGGRNQPFGRPPVS